MAGTFTVFAIRTSRADGGHGSSGRIVRRRGDLRPGQDVLVVAALQWCWAHLKRDFQALIDHPGDTRSNAWAATPDAQANCCSALWARYRDGTLTRRGWLRLMRPIRRKVDALLLRGVFSGNVA